MTKKRGRPSPGDLMTRVVALVPRARPEPPAELTDEQRQVWQDTLSMLPPEWVQREALPVLAAFVRHVTAARRIATLIDTFDEVGPDRVRDYDRLLRAQALESATITSIATRLRLTPQSRYTPQRAGRMRDDATDSPKPWE